MASQTWAEALGARFERALDVTMRSTRAKKERRTSRSKVARAVKPARRASGTKPLQPFALVIDDNDDGRAVITDVLNAEGYRVESAQNGAAALALVRTAAARPFLVLVDLQMPDMDGWEFCRRAAAEPSLESVPIWIISGFVVQRPFPVGVRGVLLKPVDCDVLVELVDGAWDGR